MIFPSDFARATWFLLLNKAMFFGLILLVFFLSFLADIAFWPAIFAHYPSFLLTFCFLSALLIVKPDYFVLPFFLLAGFLLDSFSFYPQGIFTLNLVIFFLLIKLFLGFVSPRASLLTKSFFATLMLVLARLFFYLELFLFNLFFQLDRDKFFSWFNLKNELIWLLIFFGLVVLYSKLLSKFNQIFFRNRSEIKF